MAVSVQSLLRYPFIAGRISRIAPNSATMSRMYGVNLSATGSGSSASISTGATRRSAKRDITYDIFDNSRNLNSFRSPGTGPARRGAKPVGSATVRGLRSFESWPFRYEDLRDFRPLGSSNPSLVDEKAASYIAAQADIAIQRAMSTREFVFNRMLKGTMGLKEVGDDWIPVVPNSAGDNYDFLVDWKLPDTHKEQLALDGSADIITASWANAGTDVVTQLHNLRSIAAARSGLEPTEIWMNSKLFAQLQNNTKLQLSGGSVFRVFDVFRREVQPSSSVGQESLTTPTPSYYYQFRGLPQMNIHVYDGVFIPQVIESSFAASTQTTTGTSLHKYIGDNEVIITPSPTQRQWFEVFDIMEHVVEQYGQSVKEVYGFHTWARNEMKDVPSVELMMLDNFAMALNIPQAIYNPTVVF